MTTTRLLLTAWRIDWFAVLLCLGLGVLFERARERTGTRSWSFGLALAVTLLALASPIGVLAGGYLFSAHMLQHILLVLAVPPLLLMGLRPARRLAVPPVLAWLCGVGAMWLWHAPTLCNAASQSIGVQRLQTLSLIAMGSAFWWPIVGSATQRLSPFGGIVYLFTACAACTVLGVLVTFSPVEVCSVYAHPVDRLGALPLLRDGWGLTPKADQELGGLLMWVPGCLVYAGSILAMYGRYVRGDLALGPTKETS